jgi:ribosomal protein S28E/S33
MAIPAEVVQVLGTMGVKGVRRVRCRVIEGAETKFLIRNVAGIVRIGDVLMLKESDVETEAKLTKKG